MTGKSINNVIRIPTKRSKFFEYWFKFLGPFHNLTNKEITVAAALVENRCKLAKSVVNKDILDSLSLSVESRKQVREACNITPAHFNVILGKLKKSKIIIDNRINPKFIPNVNDGDNFQLLITFDYEA